MMDELELDQDYCRFNQADLELGGILNLGRRGRKETVIVVSNFECILYY